MNTSHAGCTGFSLVELLVALVVGAILAHALLSAQQYSLYLATDEHRIWDNLNMTQELFAVRGMQELSRRPTGTWMEISGSPGGKWRTEQDVETDSECYWFELQTDMEGKVLTWSWPVSR